jgi:hypothetical protein
MNDILPLNMMEPIFEATAWSCSGTSTGARRPEYPFAALTIIAISCERLVTLALSGPARRCRTLSEITARQWPRSLPPRRKRSLLDREFILPVLARGPLHCLKELWG